MSAQYDDSFLLAGEYYAIAGITSDVCRPTLFDPRAHGMNPTANNSACWRGYVAAYGLRDDRLVLEELEINVHSQEWEEELKRLRELKEIRSHLPPLQRGPKPRPKCMKGGACGPAINGVLPVAPPDPKTSGAFSNNYHNVGLPLPFTGGVLLARGFIEDLYEHMGFHPAWKYQTVVEILFRDGLLIAKHDRSAAMAEQREAHLAEGGENTSHYSSPEAMVQWIDDCFDRRY